MPRHKRFRSYLRHGLPRFTTTVHYIDLAKIRPARIMLLPQLPTCDTTFETSASPRTTHDRGPTREVQLHASQRSDSDQRPY